MLKLFQIKVSLLKNAKNLKKLLKIRGFLSKNLEINTILIIRMRTNRGSTVYSQYSNNTYLMRWNLYLNVCNRQHSTLKNARLVESDSLKNVFDFKVISVFFQNFITSESLNLAAHYLMGLGPNWKKILHNSRKQIRIPEGM